MGEIDKPTYPTPMDRIEMWLNLDARTDAERLRRIEVLREAIADEREAGAKKERERIRYAVTHSGLYLAKHSDEGIRAIIDAGGPQEDV